MTTSEDRAEWERELCVPSDFAATRPSSDAQPRSGVGASPSTREAGEGARVARYAEAVALSEGVTPGTDPWHDAAARAVMAVADEEQAKLRSRLIDRIAEFDPSDEYHGGYHYDDRSYYAAIDRCVRLINGSLTDWRAR